VESNRVKKLNFWLPLKKYPFPLLLDGGRMGFSDASIKEFVPPIYGVLVVAVHVSDIVINLISLQLQPHDKR
jgi:hypothetical protein